MADAHDILLEIFCITKYVNLPTLTGFRKNPYSQENKQKEFEINVMKRFLEQNYFAKNCLLT